ncbi:BON domain-containing protein [Symbioplanes lichenis]|uniref:BON domain-containing protein n=1 Tax=Symbioplanes lichenis TaxID=1629072 RepID=UPI002738DBDB|nr:BON domain-containing protein [Actinoplanes lichenis]
MLPPPGRDGHLTGTVAAVLAADERLHGQHLSVQVQHGVAILGGTVDTAALHDVVTGHVRRVPGVRDVCDGLVVRSGFLIGPARDAAQFGELAAHLATLDHHDAGQTRSRPEPPPGVLPGLPPPGVLRGLPTHRVLRMLRRIALGVAAVVVLAELVGELVLLVAVGVIARIADLLLRRRRTDA